MRKTKIIWKGDLTGIADASIVLVITNQPFIRCGNITLGCLVLQPIIRAVTLQTNRLWCDQLYIVYIFFRKAEDFLDMPNVFPVRRHIKSPHVGKDQAILFRFGEFLKNNFTDSVNCRPIERTEDLQHRLDHHVVVEQAQAGDLRQLLTHGHLAHGGIADDDNKLHKESLLS